jgi:hypothetical protein
MIKNGIKKTILLESSQYSKKNRTPTTIILNIVAAEKTSPNDYLNTERFHYHLLKDFIPCLKTEYL